MGEASAPFVIPSVSIILGSSLFGTAVSRCSHLPGFLKPQASPTALIPISFCRSHPNQLLPLSSQLPTPAWLLISPKTHKDGGPRRQFK
ncbi:hypothetical protein Ancab_019332 [Ancistrocladus abbreviatus]